MFQSYNFKIRQLPDKTTADKELKKEWHTLEGQEREKDATQAERRSLPQPGPWVTVACLSWTCEGISRADSCRAGQHQQVISPGRGGKKQQLSQSFLITASFLNRPHRKCRTQASLTPLPLFFLLLFLIFHPLLHLSDSFRAWRTAVRMFSSRMT